MSRRATTPPTDMIRARGCDPWDTGPATVPSISRPARECREWRRRSGAAGADGVGDRPRAGGERARVDASVRGGERVEVPDRTLEERERAPRVPALDMAEADRDLRHALPERPVRRIDLGRPPGLLEELVRLE